MANLNIKSNNDKTIAKIDVKVSLYLILQGVKKILYI